MKMQMQKKTIQEKMIRCHGLTATPTRKDG